MEPQESAPRRRRQRARGDAESAVCRSLYLDAATYALVVAVADRLQWSESRAIDRLVQLALLPYPAAAEGDVETVARRLVQLEAETEMTRKLDQELALVGLQEG